MVIPTFERSVDLIIDNKFELTTEEVEQLYNILLQDKEMNTKINILLQSINPDELEFSSMKNPLKEMAKSHELSLGELYDKIIEDPQLMNILQEIILKRLLE